MGMVREEKTVNFKTRQKTASALHTYIQARAKHQGVGYDLTK
jgi:hypothetical protein